MAGGDGFDADEGVISSVAHMLRSGAESIDALADSVPRVPDAGEVSGPMGLLVWRLVDAAAEAATGAAVAAASVEQGGRAYAEVDERARRDLTQTGDR